MERVLRRCFPFVIAFFFSDRNDNDCDDATSCDRIRRDNQVELLGELREDADGGEIDFRRISLANPSFSRV
jgi:hypothetical protein